VLTIEMTSPITAEAVGVPPAPGPNSMILSKLSDSRNTAL
jgi:hypothetical protein